MKLSIFLLVVAIIVPVGCARARLDRLAASARPYDAAALDSEVPPAAEPVAAFEVTDRVEIRTSAGTMVVGLYGKNAPRTVENFLSYVDSRFYAGKVFHRVIPGFMIQGGGFSASLDRAETGPSIPLEIIAGLGHGPGTISMARTNVLDSATSQFFICVAEAAQLNGEYAAFGMLEEGFDVATAISRVPTATVEADLTAMDDVPVDAVIIESVTRL